MAPTRKHTRQSILEASFNFVREYGYEKISARRIANYINASTAPIYSNFKSIEELESKLEEKAVKLLNEILSENLESDDTSCLDIPLKYVEFSIEERNLFNQISKSQKAINFIKGRLENELYDKMISYIKKQDFTEGLSEEQLQKIMTNVWLQTHGIASFLDMSKSKEENMKIAEKLLKNILQSSVWAEKNKFELNNI